MKHDDGLHVRIESRQAIAFSEHDNPHELKSKTFKGFFSSCIIVAYKRQLFYVKLKVDKHFKWHDADGLLITIATKDGFKGNVRAGQHRSFWLDSECKRLHNEHAFDQCKETTNSRKQDKMAPFSIPEATGTPGSATDQWMNNEPYRPNKGCIVVCIRRAMLSGSKPDIVDTECGTKVPFREYYSKNPSPIKSTWVETSGAQHSRPYLFEYRVMHREPTAPDLQYAPCRGAKANLDRLRSVATITSTKVQAINTGAARAVANAQTGAKKAARPMKTVSTTKLPTSKNKLCDPKVQKTKASVKLLSKPANPSRPAKKLKTGNGSYTSSQPKRITTTDQDDEELPRKKSVLKDERGSTVKQFHAMKPEQRPIPANVRKTDGKMAQRSAVMQAEQPQMSLCAESALNQTDVHYAPSADKSSGTGIDDIEDLKLQLQEVQLLRRIRALEKKKPIQDRT